MNRHRAVFNGAWFRRLVAVAGLVCGSTAALGQTNNWTSASSGHWEDNSWSLGILPAANLSVMITNAGSKAVGIFSTTSANFPASLTVSDLTVSAPDGWKNTLLLNFFGTAIPLSILNNCTIGTNASLDNLFSGLQIGGDLTLYGSFVQEGGVTSATNGTVTVYGSMLLTNASVSFPNLFAAGADLMVQSGGSLDTSNLDVENFTLYAGSLRAQTAFLGNFSEQGGEFDSVISSFSGNSSITNGLLVSSNIEVAYNSFWQAGGNVEAKGSVFLFGLLEDYGPPLIGSYNLQGGFLQCQSLSMGEVGYFDQTSGTNCVGGDVSMDRGGYELEGGFLADSNAIVYNDGFFEDIATIFSQSGGVHWITNALTCYGQYQFSGGLLVAPTIALNGGSFTVDSGAVISNRAAIVFNGGSIEVNNTTQRLASALLAGYSTIRFDPGSNRLMFADSSTETWSNSTQLIILGWNGSMWGGGSDQLFFGNSARALSPAQLQRIEFVSPPGFQGQDLFATILPTGEVVPSTQPVLALSKSGTNLVLQWPAFSGFILQASTNVAGPFEDISNAAPPFTNDTSQFPRRFFRLRQQ